MSAPASDRDLPGAFGAGGAGPEQVPPPPGPPGSRYGWFVGVVAVLVVAYITLNTVVTAPRGSQGPTAGSQLPPFAVPLATSNLNGDADIATRPNQGGAGRVPACQERGPRILNSCQLAARGPVALGLFIPGGGCSRVLDELAALQRSFPQVQMAGVAIRGSRTDVRALIRQHGWPFPVGHDRDGALANLYHMALCSQITLAERGGRVHGRSLLGTPSPASARAALQSLVATGTGP
jgi:hypothetical protein